MLVINRLCSSIIGILMISQFFDPRGKRKKTNQIMFGTLVVEAIVVMNAGFRDSSVLFTLAEVVVVASLFFAFYPLFYASVKKWVLVYLALINISIVTTVVAFVVSNIITSNDRDQAIAYGMIRLALFAVWLIAIGIYGRDVFERMCHWKNCRTYAIIKIVLSCFIIPPYLNYVYKFAGIQSDFIRKQGKQNVQENSERTSCRSAVKHLLYCLQRIQHRSKYRRNHIFRRSQCRTCR